jgi:hypothetical protein
MWRGKWMMKKRTRKHRDQLRRTSCGSAWRLLSPNWQRRKEKKIVEKRKNKWKK